MTEFSKGTILAASWGHEQTNVDFFRVDKVSGDWLTLQQIAAQEVSDGAQSMTGRAVPAEPQQLVGEPFRRKQRTGGGCVSSFIAVNRFTFAQPWDGTPQRVSHYA